MIKIKLSNKESIIGYLHIFEDKIGGGLNGGVKFCKDSELKNGSILEEKIPLFEQAELTK